jgi:hypothetical protein
VNVEQAQDTLASAEMIEAKVERTREAIEEYFGLPVELGVRADWSSGHLGGENLEFLLKSPTGKKVHSVQVWWRGAGSRGGASTTFETLNFTIEQIWESAVG